MIDCKDPAGALGDISPRRVTTVADAVMGYKRDLEVQISTNIGENQLLFKGDDKGRAVQRFDNEIAGKASQAALGVAAAMGTDAHPVNIVKVGLDGMPRKIALETMKEVVDTVHGNQYFQRTEVVAVFLAQDIAVWNKEKRIRLPSGTFFFCASMSWTWAAAWTSTSSSAMILTQWRPSRRRSGRTC